MHGENFFPAAMPEQQIFPAARTYGQLESVRDFDHVSRNILSAWQVLRNRDRSRKIVAIAIRRKVSRALLDGFLRAMLMESASSAMHRMSFCALIFQVCRSIYLFAHSFWSGRNADGAKVRFWLILRARLTLGAAHRAPRARMRRGGWRARRRGL